MGKGKALSKILGGASDLSRQTDTLLRKTGSELPSVVPAADLSRVRTPELGLRDGFTNGRYPQSEISKFEANSNYVPRDWKKGSVTEDVLYGTDGRGSKPAEFVDDVKQVKQNLEARGDLPSTLRTAESVNNIRVDADGIPRYTEPVAKQFDEDITRTGGGEGGKAGLTNTGRKKGEITSFKDAWARQTIGPFKHHHILDMDFLGEVLNRVDFQEILGHLKQRFGIEGGDRAGNIIGMMDEKTNFRRFSAQESILQQLADNPNMPDWNARTLKEATKEQKRILDDLLKSPDIKGSPDLPKGGRIVNVNKNLTLEVPSDGKWKGKGKDLVPNKQPWAKPTDPESYGLPRGKELKRGYEIADTWPDGSPVTDLQKQQAYQNRWKKWNIDRKKVKFDPKQQILSPDHMDIVHAAYDSPKFTLKRQIEQMTKTDAWRRVPPMQAAEMIAQVYEIQRNIVLNVAKRRLNLIKSYLKNTVAKHSPAQVDMLLRDPYELREWVLKNKAKAASLNITKKNPQFNLLKEDPGKITEELQVVFATELENLQNLTAFAESFTSQL
tara:strand:+ start:81 stop:1742 length:1662 start_codon:yes stop_codon:yes gene_type:complete